MARSLGYVRKTSIRKSGGKSGKSRGGSLPKALWFLYPVLFVYFFQSMAYGSLIEGFSFLLFDLYPFIVTTFLAGALSIVLWWLTGNKWLSFSLLHIVGAVIALGSRITLSAVNSGLAVNNLGIFNELQLISNTPIGVYVPYLLILVLAMLVLNLIVYNLHDWTVPIKNRVPSGIILALAFVFLSQVIVPAMTLAEDKMAEVEHLGVLLYFNNGFSAKHRLSYPDEETIDAIMKEVEIGSRNTSIKANVVMVQLNNFVDLTRLKNFETDPLPTYHNIYNDASRYLLDLSTEQGDNLDLEFEVLTGLPADFYPNDSQVRGSNTTKGTISLGSIFSSLGYVSTAVLPYPEAESQRQLFYNNLGFDELVSLEDLGSGKPEDILAGISESLKDAGDQPVFIYSQIDLLKDEYTKTPEESYLADLRLLDGYLLQLKEIVGSSKEPTIIVLYSDGMPVLGVDDKLLYEYGAVDSKDTSIETSSKLNEGDLLIWNNYNRSNTVYPAGEKFNLSGLGPLVMNYGDFNMPNYFYFINHLKDAKRLDGISKEYLQLDSVLYASDSDTYEELAHEYIIIVKDILGPNKYAEEDKDKWINK